ncbi:hypothetical protein BLNAU_12012 [Blattamonas nauphoetae]|uniref:RRM domain-containing protein n=1 Tax=Blattamonas nauphoetae TaxID=2049346 RepID=A0ABQ9XKS4_9EUKA|nr:hypothetical protein BLNAU_12012 [Blattamonas nauphoetae]
MNRRHTPSPSHTADGIDPYNIFINYLPPHFKDENLFSLFSSFGNIESAKVMMDSSRGTTLGFGFVRFTTQQAAHRALQTMNRFRVGNKVLLVKYSNVSRVKEPFSPCETLFIRNLPKQTTQETLHKLFSPIAHPLIIRITNDHSLSCLNSCVAYVRFSTIQDAEHIRQTFANTIFPHSRNLLDIAYAKRNLEEFPPKAGHPGAGGLEESLIWAPTASSPAIPQNAVATRGPPYRNHSPTISSQSLTPPFFQQYSISNHHIHPDVLDQRLPVAHQQLSHEPANQQPISTYTNSSGSQILFSVGYRAIPLSPTPVHQITSIPQTSPPLPNSSIPQSTPRQNNRPRNSRSGYAKRGEISFGLPQIDPQSNVNRVTLPVISDQINRRSKGKGHQTRRERKAHSKQQAHPRQQNRSLSNQLSNIPLVPVHNSQQNVEPPQINHIAQATEVKWTDPPPQPIADVKPTSKPPTQSIQSQDLPASHDHQHLFPSMFDELSFTSFKTHGSGSETNIDSLSQTSRTEQTMLERDFGDYPMTPNSDHFHHNSRSISGHTSGSDEHAFTVSDMTVSRKRTSLLNNSEVPDSIQSDDIPVTQPIEWLLKTSTDKEKEMDDLAFLGDQQEELIELGGEEETDSPSPTYDNVLDTSM